MRILLTKDVEHRMIMHMPGRNMADKKTSFQQMVNQAYFLVLQGYAGMWLPVFTNYLFTHSFNVDLETNGTYDVQQNLVEDVDLSPEFKTVEQWIAAVQKRYDKDWPGTDCAREMHFWHDRLKERYD